METQPSILVIDDEPDNFDVVETLLDGENYQLHYASGGQQAIARLSSFQPDVILLDVMMPHLDGIEVCRRIKADPQWQAVPIIIVTALTAKEDLAHCLNAGADDFISKPLNSVELRARVNSMLRIKQQHDNLQGLLKLQEDMVNMIVHDLRNPLASIVISTEMLKFPSLPPDKQQQKVSQIAIACQQLQTLIDSLLTMAKLESGKMVLNYTEIDLCAICISALADIEDIAAQKRLRLISELPEPGGMVKIDAAIFRRVLDNLLSNAIKFSPSNARVILKAAYLETGAKLQVIDSGKGISQELRHSIFQKYEIGNIVSEVSQLGLGLAFCKMAIEAHNGTITIEDNHPQGSIFTVLIP
ncbi:response regulator [Anabaena sp. FACHB-709]|uniref:histidine kinase n=2 Tax=Nostocaceae TaxID=1162 RepID=A0A1Z4KLG9_ANAVA|nr:MULTISPECIES: hybrid sensor histidine kinase/response regulator [Nostocaceae]BAY69723.1 two-component hybrid sensor and regulator [Trichormus variabilis NIES-23]HBW33143.1 hybrid sensor histidine kinase/response regulator [Nostoc sp. UBA8866]MBD2175102.1 hybrid sensor histidine kinase/response regulator [Anabaena cylindrica FACHB-318]MBD2266976.1 hybrid sensor histidine kinase/response regulator [Anabaena sp. FACHB-709]MBD2276552.1 hybrid sensor histidine kinase/response regulator [Nostoc s